MNNDAYFKISVNWLVKHIDRNADSVWSQETLNAKFYDEIAETAKEVGLETVYISEPDLRHFVKYYVKGKQRIR